MDRTRNLPLDASELDRWATSAMGGRLGLEIGESGRVVRSGALSFHSLLADPGRCRRADRQVLGAVVSVQWALLGFPRSKSEKQEARHVRHKSPRTNQPSQPSLSSISSNAELSPLHGIQPQRRRRSSLHRRHVRSRPHPSSYVSNPFTRKSKTTAHAMHRAQWICDLCVEGTGTLNRFATVRSLHPKIDSLTLTY